jgi:hypothetical protein
MVPHEIANALMPADNLSCAAVAAAFARRDETIPLSLGAIDCLQTTTRDTLSNAECTESTIVFLLMVDQRDPWAYHSLVLLMRRDSTVFNDILGDGPTDGAAKVTAGVLDDGLVPTTDIIECGETDEFMRCHDQRAVHHCLRALHPTASRRVVPEAGQLQRSRWLSSQNASQATIAAGNPLFTSGRTNNGHPRSPEAIALSTRSHENSGPLANWPIIHSKKPLKLEFERRKVHS